MKYSVNNYVKAFTELIAELPADRHEKLTGQFIKLLGRTGDIRHNEKILEAVHRRLVNSNGGKWVVIETARDTATVRELKSKFSNRDYVEFKINLELTAGVRITINGEEELDNTLNNKLNKLFK